MPLVHLCLLVFPCQMLTGVTSMHIFIVTTHLITAIGNTHILYMMQSKDQVQQSLYQVGGRLKIKMMDQ